MAIYTKTGIMICTDFNRIVHGDRGDYIEFLPLQAIWKNYYIPTEQLWRIGNNTCYYIEYRTVKDYIKIYHQKRIVDYADYRIGFLYVSPNDTVKMKNILSYLHN